MQKVVPALRVKSYKDSLTFYEKLDFKEIWKHQFSPKHPVFASITFEEMEIFLTEHSGDCQFGGLVHFYISDIDGYYRKITERRVLVSEAPNNSLGQDIRDMLVIDPDGNRLSFITRNSNT